MLREPALEAQVGELWGGRSAARYERVAQRACQGRAGQVVLEVAYKPSATFVAGLCLELKDTDADWPALLLGNYLLGGSGASR